jgi:hypothetical protein
VQRYVTTKMISLPDFFAAGQPVSIIRHSGVVFEGKHGRKYVFAIGKIIDGVQSALEEVNKGVRIFLPPLPLLSHPLSS